ncbi:MAG: MaoC family dehydratase [Acidobacteria bacterium]|nr:MaoC family dehydratase [Acidobacteriota bacterium]MBK8151453.1 MaoC family dehydratase [Acidobacteriota bacterium]MBK8812675.1 MaoC family dehydratase [Acidobacteriota bacterium]
MDLKVGDVFSVTKEVTDEVIRKFADVSGDYNPIHLDDDFASKTRFGKRIAHGMLGAAFISAVLGYELSERKLVYMSQTLRFIAPVFLGDTVTAKAVVTAIREDKPVVTIETTVSTPNGDCITGEAKILILE